MAKWYEKVWDFVTSGSAKDYANLTKAGIAALSSYASFKDQQKKTEMAQDAYDDYMKQAQAAGFEAQAAIDLNLTPMTISGVPTTKADITDFTAVAAKGGLMSIPNKQRKRYAYGTDDDDVMEIEEEVLTPFDLEKETGLDLSGEQVKYNTANPREGAWNVWNSGGINQEIYEFDFEIFFDSGDWMDMLKGQAPVQENMQMASDPTWESEWEDIYQNYVAKQIELGQEFVDKETFIMDYKNNMAICGIIGLRQGGRPGYNIGGGPIDDVFMTEEQASMGNPGNAEMYPEDIYEFKTKPILDKLDYIKSLSPEAQEALADEVESLMLELQNIENPPKFKTGGVAGLRKGYRLGDEVVEDRETIVKTPNEEVVINDMEEIKGQTAGPDWYIKRIEHLEFLGYDYDEASRIAFSDDEYYAIVGDPYAKGGRAGYRLGDKVVADTSGIGGLDGMLNLGGMEKDYRFNGGFVPIGEYEKKDDVPARLSKNEFVFTADAVRAAGGGSINKGAQRMYDTMKNLEARPDAKRMTA